MGKNLKIVQMLCPESKYKYKCPYSMKPEYVTIHNTYNKASAKSEVSYMISNNNKVSYHVAVDDIQAVQGVKFSRNTWNAGDGNGSGNRKSISIEICYSTGDSKKFAKAEDNAAYLAAVLLNKYGLGMSRLKKHQDWSGKYCPHKTLDLGWNRFKKMVEKYFDELNGKKTNSSSSTTTNKTPSKLSIDGDWGKDTTKLSQKVFKTSQDGKISNQPTSNKKYLANANTSSWEFKSSNYKAGSSLIKAIQKLVGSSQDGLCGKNTVKAIQKFLKDKKFYTGKVDGSLGPGTVKGWQKYINSRI